MIQTEIEGLLEKGLQALEVGFGRRIGSREFVDYVCRNPDALDRINKYFRFSKNGMSDVAVNFAIQSMSEDEIIIVTNAIPTFYRVSGGINGYLIKYELNLPVEFGGIEDLDIVDDLIRADKHTSETVKIRSVLGDLLVCVDIGKRADNTRKVSVDIDKSELAVIWAYMDKAELINALDGQQYDPERIVNTVLEFIS